MAFFIVIIQLILFSAHWALYKTAARFFGLAGTAAILPLKIVLAVLSVSLVLGSLLSFSYDSWPVKIFYNLAAYWLGFLYFFVLASILVWLVYGFCGLTHLMVNFKIIAAIFFSAAVLIGIYGVANARNVRVVQVSISLPNLPSAWQGKKAVWISDTHLGQVWGEKTAQELAEKIKGLQPDIVFIGGDLYDGVAADLDKLAEPFGKIKAPLGVYFITGNHEEFFDKAKYLDAVRRQGIKVLDNEMADINGLEIVGVDYNDSSDRAKLEEILRNIGLDESKPSILLKHAPLDLDIAANAGISLQLSGHTHQGQVFLFKYITRLVYKGYDYGSKAFGAMQVFTSAGAGTWGPPMRVDTKPDIALIRFK